MAKEDLSRNGGTDDPFTHDAVDDNSRAGGAYDDLPGSLWHFFIVAFDAAPGVVYMGQLAEAYRYGLSVKEIVDIFTGKPEFTERYPNALGHQELAERLVSNIVKDSATEEAKLEAVDDIREALDIGWSEGDVVYTVFGNLASKSFDDSTWGGTARQSANEIAVARVYTEVMKQGATDLHVLREVLHQVDEDTDFGSQEAIIALIGTAVLDPVAGV